MAILNNEHDLYASLQSTMTSEMRSTSKRNDLIHRYRQPEQEKDAKARKKWRRCSHFREKGETESEAQRKLSPSINIYCLCAHAACLLLLLLMMIFKIMLRYARSSRFFFLTHSFSLYRVTIVLACYCTNDGTIFLDICS
jgi:hypothetical protein